MSQTSPSSSIPTVQPIDIRTSLLYGVFASQKSFMIGERNLVKRQYADWITWKAIEDRLPQEMVDLIADELYQLEKASVIAQWDMSVPSQWNFTHFLHAPRDTRWYRAATRKIADAAPDVICVNVGNDRPGIGQLIMGRETVNYIHVSAVKQRPALAINLPPRSPADPSQYHSHPFQYSTGGDGYATVRMMNGRDSAVYHGNNETSGIAQSKIARLLQCDGVEGAIKDWDAEALERLVDLLELKMIVFDSPDPMKPGLHISQTIEEP